MWDSALAVSFLRLTELSETLKSVYSLVEDFQQEGKVGFVGSCQLIQEVLLSASTIHFSCWQK